MKFNLRPYPEEQGEALEFQRADTFHFLTFCTP